MDRDQLLNDLLDKAPLIAPSMLKCDFANLGPQTRRLDEVGTEIFHWDVMDGHFVPNLSYGAMVIKAVREATGKPFDAHLMISDPAKYLDDFIDAGCDAITFHIEAVPEPKPLLERIRNAGALAGLALNPDTPVETILPHVEHCDLVLVMSVNPGFGGQKFMPIALEKIQALKQACGSETLLSVDGGIAADTIPLVAEAGANLFVCGSSIFNEVDFGHAMNNLRHHALRATAS